MFDIIINVVYGLYLRIKKENNMNTIKYDGNKVSASADNIKQIIKDVKRLSDSVSAVSTQLGMMGNSADIVKQKMLSMHDEILQEAVMMESLHSALSKIVTLYEQTEKRIADGANSSADYIASALGRKFADIVSNSPNYSGSAYTLLDLLHDMYMKSQIEALNEKYTQDDWDNATEDERKEMLNNYIHDLYAILGVDVGDLQFKEMSAPPGYVKNGGYQPDSKYIALNQDIVNGNINYSLDKIKMILIHETRHAYQHAVVDNPENFKVSAETREQWKESIDNYHNQQGYMDLGYDKEEAYQLYKDQRIEQDARWFSGDVV